MVIRIFLENIVLLSFVTRKINYSRMVSKYEIKINNDESFTIDRTLFPSMYIAIDTPKDPNIIPMKFLNDGIWLSDPLAFDDNQAEMVFYRF